jgi:hypothetical protein
MWFDPAKVLLDPYGRGTVVPKNYSRKAARKEGDNCATAMKSVVVDPRAYDWEGDTLLNRPYRGGVDTMLNALNSDQDLFAAEVSLAQTRLAELLSLVQRYKALGGGWQE